MPNLSSLLRLASERARILALPYAGALTPVETAEILQLAPEARLVDIRSHAELDWVGRIPQAVEIEWSYYPEMALNPHFIVHLKKQLDLESLVFFICRSGLRSDLAARLATKAGFPNCYNVLEGFEGDKDAHGQRNKISGWRRAGLPWTQS